MVHGVPELAKTPEIRDKLTTVEKALARIRPGDHVFVGSACATPRTLLQGLEKVKRNLADVELFHFLTDGAAPSSENNHRDQLRHKIFFVGTDMREPVKQGLADYIPISITQVPLMLENGTLPVDVALIQTSMPDRHGFVSLGVSVDIARSAINRARIIIAELNPKMPRTQGETNIPVEMIDYLVPVDTEIIEYLHPPADEIAQQIARYVARIIDDGSTLQIGLGQIPNEMLKYLCHRRDLGIHSDVITEPIVDLVEKGVITGKAKSIHKGKIVCSYCMGSRRLYDFIDNNPMFAFYPIDYVCRPELIASNTKFTSVSQAFAVDLTGQVCTDQFEGEFYGGVSTQSDFLRGAARSPGGKAIICLASTSGDGKCSRIRPLLQRGEGVTVPRSEVHYIITEYGSAYLFGKSIRERALSLIEIAHPDFRMELLEEAKALGYVRPEQKLRSKIAYPANEDRIVKLKNHEKVLIRPSRASDVEKLQEIFYDLTIKDVYTRFFSHLRALPVSKAEYLCNVDYENDMAFVAVAGNREINRIVGSACYFANPSTNLVEVAYMILPEYQGIGLGSALQTRMAEYAKGKGFRGFTASILAENEKMVRLANRSGNFSSITMQQTGAEYEVTMLF